MKARIALAVMALALTSVITPVTAVAAAPAAAASNVAAVSYTGLIRAVAQPGLCIHVFGSGDRERVHIDYCEYATQWQFRTDSVGSGVGTFRTSVYSKCLGVRDASMQDYAWIQQNGCNGNTSQQWRYDFNGRIINLKSGKCVYAQVLDVFRGLIQIDCNAVDAAQWRHDALGP